MAAPNSPEYLVPPLPPQQSPLQRAAVFLRSNGMALLVIVFWGCLLAMAATIACVFIRATIWAATSVIKALGI